jgi:hypothetical protein
MRVSIKLAICLALLLTAPQIAARADSLKEWSRRFNVIIRRGHGYISGKSVTQQGVDHSYPGKVQSEGG